MDLMSCLEIAAVDSGPGFLRHRSGLMSTLDRNLLKVQVQVVSMRTVRNSLVDCERLVMCKP
jgi:hypothetical protein